MKRRLFVLACVIAVLTVLTITVSSAFGGGIVNDPRVCDPMQNAGPARIPLPGAGPVKAQSVYDALCTDQNPPAQLPTLP